MTKKNRPEKTLSRILKKRSGRDGQGKISVRHQGGRHKRLYREIDFRRDKREISGKVVALEYDPNRGADIALIFYKDGEKRYILAPIGLKIGDKIMASEQGEIKTGNALPLTKIPVGMPIHNIELNWGLGGQLVRGAGLSASILAKEGKMVRVKLPSGEVRLIAGRCYATIGQVGNVERKGRKLGKAGAKRHLGIRPTVRGVAQDPGSHPHGGGEGRSGIGMPGPKTPWGKPALGKRTRRPQASDKFIIERRK